MNQGFLMNLNRIGFMNKNILKESHRCATLFNPTTVAHNWDKFQNATYLKAIKHSNRRR